jgi:predicted TIM-barrel fold metal-dependent hydrolase
MAGSAFERYRVVDIDTHVTEPADVWTSRVSRKWGERVPHVKRIGKTDVWFIGDRAVHAPGVVSAAGFDGTYPKYRRTYEEIPPAMYDAKARLALMDDEVIHANVLFPNLGGFSTAGFRELGEPELMLACVRAYNDWLFEWAGADRGRLIPVMANPFWDVGACVREIERCALLGYKAALLCNQPHHHGHPPLRDKHWDPFWAAAQDADMSVNFHVGAGDTSETDNDVNQIGQKANFARASTLFFLENGHCIADLLMGGVCHRFPRLKLVSVESGVGWIPFVLEALDWQWQNNGVPEEHPEYDLLPSEYFRRQIYGAFWFEEKGIRSALELFPDNLLFETDYPHPTCQAPGPASIGTHPRLYADRALQGVPEDTIRKVLQDTAAEVYGIAPAERVST